MNVKEISFDDGGELETVTVKMTIQEAVAVTGLIANMRGCDPVEFPETLRTALHEVCGVMSSRVFNAYYDDGIIDALNDFGVKQ